MIVYHVMVSLSVNIMSVRPAVPEGQCTMSVGPAVPEGQCTM